MDSAAENLRICHVNCQSLVAHLDEFRLFFEDEHFHVICLSETWLVPSISDAFISLPGYTIHRCDRTGKKGGGVAMLIISSLKVKILSTSGGIHCSKPEFLIAEISSNLDKILIATVYRPPHIGFIAEFESTLLQLFSDYINLIVFGDFNADLCVPSHDSTHLRDFITSSNLHLVPYEPTHHLQESSTWLDICFVDDEDKIINFGQTDVPFLSSHDLIHIEYNISVEKASHTSTTARDFRNFRHEDFFCDLAHQSWQMIDETLDIDEKIRLFNLFLTKALDINAPHRTFLHGKKVSPWLNDNIRSLMRARDKAHRTWRRKKTSTSRAAFKILRNQVKWTTDQAKTKFYTSAFSNLSSHKETWAKLRGLGLIRNKTTPTLVSSPEDLNLHFSSVCNSTTAIEPPVFQESTYSDDKFYFTDPTPQDLLQALSSSTATSKGIDDIPIDHIKKATPILGHVILHLFSFSFMYEVFPSLWKHAIIRPIAKIKNPLSSADYRPIALLCSLSKILEKIAAAQITKYLEDREIFDPFQSAYRTGHSTQTALLRILDEAKLAANDRKVTIMVFFDFSKAFDRVVHCKLIDILRRLGFSNSALAWILSYLTNRSQRVVDQNGRTSSWSSTNTGVPQGSVLGPLLFSLYISGLNKILHFCSYNVYADDIQISLSCYPKDLAAGIAKINKDIGKIVLWANDLGLLLNNAKTKAMIVGTARFINDIDQTAIPKICVDGTEIIYSEEVLYLGKTLCSTLKWNADAKAISRRVYSTLHQLKVAKSLLPQNVRKMVINSIVFPLLDYCCITTLDISKEAELLVQRSFNSCIRFITGANRFEHISPYYTYLNWLKIPARRKYFLGCTIFSIIHDKRPTYLHENFTFRASTAHYSTRTDALTLNVPNTRIELFRRSFRVSGPNFWNSLPFELREVSSINVFKKTLFSLLLKGEPSLCAS